MIRDLRFLQMTFPAYHLLYGKNTALNAPCRLVTEHAPITKGEWTVIDMNEWGKLESFFFPTSYEYLTIKINECIVSFLQMGKIFSQDKKQ